MHIGDALTVLYFLQVKHSRLQARPRQVWLPDGLARQPYFAGRIAVLAL